jgi:hypothetical protein
MNLDGVREGRDVVDGSGRGSKVSEDMVVRGASTIEENVDIERGWRYKSGRGEVVVENGVERTILCVRGQRVSLRIQFFICVRK